MIEGIGSMFTAAFGQIPTLFSYFNPSRSPYYAMTVACIAGLCVIFAFENAAWVAALIPIGILLAVLAIVTLSSPKSLFTVEEYNDQLKFARSLAITTAAVCIFVLVLNPDNGLGYRPTYGSTQNTQATDIYLSVPISVVYAFCIAQILLFLAYQFVFGDYREGGNFRASSTGDKSMGEVDLTLQAQLGPKLSREERNYVQIALVMCAYLAGMTWVTTRVTGQAKTFTAFEGWLLVLFGGIWIASAIQVLLFVKRNFQLKPPIDRAQPFHPHGANLIAIQEYRADRTERPGADG